MTEIEYIEHLERLDREKCAHPLMTMLKTGFSVVNCVYLRLVLDSQPAPVPSFDLKVLYARKSRLFGERAQASNKMCDLPEDSRYDRDRADYSQKIQAIQRDIETVMQEIARHERGIYMPAADNALPVDRAALIKKQLSVRASLSRARSKAKHAKKEEKADADAKVLKYEKELSDVENRLKNP